VKTYIGEVQKISTNDKVLSMTESLMRRAYQCTGASKEEVINGVKGYFAARKILEEKKGDSMTLAGCVNLLKYRPCIAWVTLSDEGIPSACEGDLEAIAAKTIVQYLFNRPGFQQDPVPDTANQAFIGAHCQCATRLNGFDNPPEPFNISHHHGNTDATIVPEWQQGQKVTAIDVTNKKEEQTEIRLFTGTVLDNISVPPNGGCVVSVRFNIDGINNSQEVLTAPGFHQVFFYGNYGREIEDFCKLYNIKLLKYS
jgi:L-arabinose isomerase